MGSKSYFNSPRDNQGKGKESFDANNRSNSRGGENGRTNGSSSGNSNSGSSKMGKVISDTRKKLGNNFR
jgi:hypothetical protein